jgi:hypothetical protein
LAWHDVPGFINVILNASITDLLLPNQKVVAIVGMSSPAAGDVFYATPPADGDTVTLNGVIFEFKDSPGAGEVQTEATAEAAVDNLITAIDALIAAEGLSAPLLRFADYENSGGDLIITSYHQPVVDSIEVIPGAEGYDPNAYTLAVTGSGVVSGETLTGGELVEKRLTPLAFLIALFAALPTSDPMTAGQPYIDAGFVKISAG